MMECDPVKISQFLTGDMPPEEMQTVLDHLDACPDCRAVFDDLLKFKILAPEVRWELSGGFFNFAEASPALRRRAWVLGLATAAVLVLVAGLFVLRHYALQQLGGPMGELLETGAIAYVPPVVRGGAAAVDPARERIMAAYTGGDYEGFIAAAADWLKTHPEDEGVMLHAGVAAYLEGRHSIAAIYLRWAIETGGTPRPEEEWYLANALLRQRLNAEARPLLEHLAGLDHPYAARARAILAALDKQTQVRE
jgi:hypothetical protein